MITNPKASSLKSDNKNNNKSQKITKKIAKKPVQKKQKKEPKKEKKPVINPQQDEKQKNQKQARIAKNCWMLCFRRFSRILKQGDQETNVQKKKGKKSNKKIHDYELKIYRLLKDQDQETLNRAQIYFSENENQTKITSIMKLRSVLKDMGTELESFMINGLILWVQSGCYEEYIDSISDINSETIRKNNPYRTSESEKILEFLLNYQKDSSEFPNLSCDQEEMDLEQDSIQEEDEQQQQDQEQQEEEIEIKSCKKKSRRKSYQQQQQQQCQEDYFKFEDLGGIQDMDYNNNNHSNFNKKDQKQKHFQQQSLIDKDQIYKLIEKAIQNSQQQQQSQENSQDLIKLQLQNIINEYSQQYLLNPQQQQNDQNYHDQDQNQDQQSNPLPTIIINNISINNPHSQNNHIIQNNNNNQNDSIDQYLNHNIENNSGDILPFPNLDSNSNDLQKDNNMFDFSKLENSNQDLEQNQQQQMSQTEENDGNLQNFMEQNQQNYQNLQQSIRNARLILDNRNHENHLVEKIEEDEEESKDMNQLQLDQNQNSSSDQYNLNLRQFSEPNSLLQSIENSDRLFNNNNVYNCKKKQNYFYDQSDIMSLPPKFSLSGHSPSMPGQQQED